MVIFLSALDATIVATIYAKIGSEFNKSNEVSWVATSYMLSSTAFQPMYGRLSDIFGRRTALLVGLLIFLAGSTLCAMAYDLNTLVLARAIAGIGGGGTLTASSIIMSDLVSLRERGRLQGFGNAVFGSASLVGAPLGGLIADTLGWRFSFWMNLPLGIVPVIMIMCFVPDYNVIKGVGFGKRIFSLSGSMVLLVLALSLGGNELPWDNFYVILYIVSGLLLLGFFIYVEGYVASHPIMPLHLLKERTPLSSFLICFFSSMSSLSSVFLIPVWFQVVLGQSTSQSGLHLIPKIVGSSFGSISAGIYMSRTGEYRKFTWLALGAMVVAETLILYRWNIHTGEEEYLPYLIIDGFGFGSVLTTTLVAMLAAIPPQDMAVSSAMTYLFRSTGSVLGVASSQAALQAVLNTALHKRFTGPDAERIIEIARKSAAELRARLSPDVVAIVVEAYVEAIQAGFVVCVVCAGLAVGASLILGRHALRS
ncbi:major facilitator superfamily domain-containing protein [Chytridium lagenaria]|nr:major facilitator superfamily domain-containing protein [Chytridium lagenaria]